MTTYKFVSEMIQTAISHGYKPLMSGKTITMFKCPSCGKIKMVKFIEPVEVFKCICGHRE